MVKTLVLRLATSLALLIVVPTLTFFIQGITPTDVARGVLGIDASPEQVAAFNQKLGLDQPLVAQYMRWLGKALHGDLGNSYQTSQSVQEILAPRIGVSLSLIIGALLVYAVVGVVLGVLSTTGGTAIGRILDAVSTLGLAVPNFWLATILVSVFSVELLLVPASGYVSLGDDPEMWFLSLLLPVIALAFGGITAVAKQTRDQMMVALESPYTRTLRANGISRFSLVYKHALRNSAGPVVTVLGTIFVGTLSGSVIIENIFVMPGLGSQALDSALQSDLPVIQGIAVYFTIIIVIVNLIIDVVTMVLNPKVRTA
ncbi:ABC transporter permease subunit [Nakamurella sp. YIM 132087]|uniref:ABC transporter permease subunit n=1 Tax=Nakamurella alba TaxID=2665158 RepID=A0A7K1FE69_9ACTN|nr:ABC transporter permease [Nakamurella alba]MTD12397.1 ABC transporter permease subunit [Nakamurella alba]